MQLETRTKREEADELEFDMGMAVAGYPIYGVLEWEWKLKNIGFPNISRAVLLLNSKYFQIFPPQKKKKINKAP